MELLEKSGSVASGGKVVLRVGLGPFHVRWIAVHRDFENGRQFVDEQTYGPFARWVHTHRVLPEGPGSSILEDQVEYALPLGALGDLVGGALVRAKLERLFAWRHEVVRADVERHGAPGGARPLRIAVSGASGFVGRALVPFLEAGGHRVSRLVRRSVVADEREIPWDPAGGRLDPTRLEGHDAVIHLAGENIAAGRWTAERKASILASRTRSTRLLAEALAGLRNPPRVLLGASAIGFYGDRGDEALDEASAAGRGFLAEVVGAWEAASEIAARADIRVVCLRFGVILNPAGGALARMLPPFLLGAGGRIGDGRAYLSWIALDDVLGAIHFALAGSALHGPVNVVAPEPVRNRDFARVLGAVLRRPALVPLPAAVVRWAFGEMGEELLLSGQRVVPRRLLDAGFRFRHGDLESALRFELGRLRPQATAAPPPRLRPALP